MALVDETIAAKGAFAVTPSDTVDLPGGVCRGVYIGGAGNLRVTMANDDVVTFTALAIGVVHPISAKRVWSTATTATSIVAIRALQRDP